MKIEISKKELGDMMYAINIAELWLDGDGRLLEKYGYKTRSKNEKALEKLGEKISGLIKGK